MVAPVLSAGHNRAMSATVLLDDARPGHERLRRYTAPFEIVQAHTPAEVPTALARLEAAVKGGAHAAGYFSYELGYVLEPRLLPLLPPDRAAPLLWFGLFDTVEILEGSAANEALCSTGRAYAGPLAHEWSEAAYATRFARVHEWIEAGDIYQANLSFRSRFAFAGDAMALYLRLRERSAAAHGAFIDDGARHILSLSPELFFDLSPEGLLTAKPMKGTIARGQDPASDHAARARLATSEKDRAENLMIVDLLRNDLGRIAQIGSVMVEDLFAVETYPTLHTMVSTITAQLKQGAGISDIVRAIFPCGSVTGAPKIRAMEIIREMESSPRGIYCGAIGHFAPDGSANFNVAIRTLTIAGNRGELGIGGAVVHDSQSASEYAECLLKARYYDSVRQPLELIETLRWSPDEGFHRLDRHLARMANSAKTFGIAFDREAAIEALASVSSPVHGGPVATAYRRPRMRDGGGASQAQRVRLTLNESGTFAATAAPLGEPKDHWTYAISPVRISSTDPLARPQDKLARTLRHRTRPSVARNRLR